MSELLYTYIRPTNPKHLERATRLLEDGEVISYPTDVNWAMGASPFSAKGVDKLARLKPDHPKNKPFSLLCADLRMVSEVAIFENSAYRILKKILPGPYTIFLKSHHDLPRIIRDKRPLVGVRIPDCPLLSDLIARLGHPLLTTSLPAGDFGRPPHFGYEVEQRFGRDLGLILDLGEEIIPAETTILDLSEGEPRLVREGVGRIPENIL